MELSDFYDRKWEDYPLKKRIKFRLEALGVRLGFSLLQLMGKNKAPVICGSILSWLGPYLPLSKMAMRNIARSMVDKTGDEIEEIIREAWRNFGYMIGEFPFIQEFDTLDEKKVILEGWEENYVNRANPEKGFIFFSAHTGNWEYISKVAEDRGVYPHRIFRAPSNPLVFPFFMKRVTKQQEKYLLPANKTAVIKCMRALKKGEPIALLTDQKAYKGVDVPFFGRNALTSPLIADIAIKNDVDILPARTIRLADGRFKVILEAPLAYEKAEDNEVTRMNLLKAMNKKIETWVSEYPEQWFWLHKRWSKYD